MTERDPEQRKKLNQALESAKAAKTAELACAKDDIDLEEDNMDVDDDDGGFASGNHDGNDYQDGSD